MTGFIKLHRELAEWEWYHDNNAIRLLIHLLISVNYKDKKWQGRVIKAGSMVLSWKSLSERCHMSVKQCRVAMDKLEQSGEVARERTNKYQVVTLVKWDKMQIEEVSRAGNGANKGQAEGKQRATTKEREERKKDNKASNEAIPAVEDVLKYALEKKPNVCRAALKLKYESWVENGWKTGGKNGHKIKNWKSTLLNTLPHIRELPKQESSKQMDQDVYAKFKK